MTTRFQIPMLLVAAMSLVAQTPPPPQPGALAPANIAKSRPKPPFDLTGTWQHGGGQNNSFRFSPLRVGTSLYRNAGRNYLGSSIFGFVGCFL